MESESDRGKKRQARVRLDAHIADGAHDKMVYPRTHRSKHLVFWKVFTYLLLACCGLIQLAAFVLIVMFAARPDLSTPNDEGFALYKNSRFHECAATLPASNNSINCADRMWDFFPGLKPMPEPDSNDTIPAPLHPHPGSNAEFAYFSSAQSGADLDGAYWCEFAWCLRNYQIIPSLPSQDFFRRSSLVAWWLYGHAVCLMIYHFKTQSFFKPHFPRDCKDKWYIVKGALIYFLISTICWWWSFAEAVRTPIKTENLWFFSWVASWRTARAFDRHPLLCSFHKREDLRRLILRALLIAAVVQFGASTYILARHVKPGANFFRCIEGDIPDAPGSSPCSPAEICGRKHMLSFLDMQRNDHLYPIVVFCFSFALFFIHVFFDFLSAMATRRRGRHSRFDCRMHDRDPHARESLLLIGLTVVFAFYAHQNIDASVDLLRNAHREAPIAIDLPCTAVHVGLSDWRQYLDVRYGWQSSVERAFRVVFNVGM